MARSESAYAAARSKLRISGREAARRARVSPATYYGVENGTRNPSAAVLYRIASALEMADLVEVLDRLTTGEAA